MDPLPIHLGGQNGRDKMAINLNREVFNTYSVAGSNFQKGFKAGNFFLPNNLNPGVEVARVHQYQIHNPVAPANISTLTGTGAVSQYFPLKGVSSAIGQIIQYDSLNMGLKLDYPRQIGITSTEPFNATFSFMDRYQNKSVVNLASIGSPGAYYIDTPLGVDILNSVLLETETGTPSFTAVLKTMDWFELPFTDYGNKTFLQSITASIEDDEDNTSIPWLRTSLTNLSAPYVLEWDAEYAPATWPSQPSTTTSAFSRPLIRFTDLGQTIDYTAKTYSFTVGQTVFPTYTAEMASLITPTQAETGMSTMGIIPVSTGWKGWQG